MTRPDWEKWCDRCGTPSATLAPHTGQKLCNDCFGRMFCGYSNHEMAVADAIRASFGQPPRTLEHWQNMWRDWGAEGDRWIRAARAAIAVEGSQGDGAWGDR